MTSFDSITLDVPDLDAAGTFFQAVGLSPYVTLRASDAPTNGFRGFALSLVVAQPGDVDTIVDAGLAAGGKVLKAAEKSFWGYGAVVLGPDGTIVKIATSKKKDIQPVSGTIDQVALLLGVADVKASKRFYVGRGLAVAKSFGGKYVEFDTPSSAVTLALYPRRALAKDSAIADDGTDSRRIVIGSDAGLTDPDGFVWETAAA